MMQVTSKNPHLLPALAVVGALVFSATACGDGIARRAEGALEVSAQGNAGERFIQFPLTAPGFRMDAPEILIKNGGDGDLTITGFDWKGDVTGYITPKTTLPEPGALSPDQELRIVFRLDVPSPIESDEPMACPDAPANLPASFDPDRYCGHFSVTSDAREANTDTVWFLVDQSSGRLSVAIDGTPDQDVINFSNPQIGLSQTHTLTLSNTSTSGALTVSKISKVDFTEGTSNDFTIEGQSFPATIPPGSSVDYDVIYTPSSAAEISGKLEIESDDPTNSKKAVSIRSSAGNAAKIEVDPTSLLFPEAAPGSPEEQEITVTNTGTGAALTINRMDIVPTEASMVYTVLWDKEKDGNFVPWTQGSTAIAQRQNSIIFKVSYEPEDASSSIPGTLRIGSNADNIVGGEVEVTLSGAAASPDGSISPSTIIFNAAPGESDSRAFSIANAGLADLEVSAIAFNALDEAEFSVTPSPVDGVITVAPGGVQAFDLTYDRMVNDIGQDVGNLVISTNNPFSDGELIINVRNNNQENALSPSAMITQDPDGNVAPGTTITLDGSGSTAEPNEIAYHIWTLIEVPDGSSATLDSENTETTTFTPDIIGSYRVQLVVGNNLGTPLEGSAIRNITVVDQ